MDVADEKRLRELIRKDTKETRRIEFKQRLVLDTPSAKAEFVRDVIALANSEGEVPRQPAWYVIGVKRGKVFDVSSGHLDGATLSDIVDGLVSPPLDIRYEEIGPKSRRIGVLTITPDERCVYLVKADYRDGNGLKLLSAGQCWGRRADKKVRLSGTEITDRMSLNVSRATATAIAPLQQRIVQLEGVLSQTGPVAEVRRIRYAIEFEFDWMRVREILNSLIPYARDFDVDVGLEVARTAEYTAGRISAATPAVAVRTIFEVLRECVKLSWGETSGAESRSRSQGELLLMVRVTEIGFRIMSDAASRTKNVEVVRAGYDFLIQILMYASAAELRDFRRKLSSMLSALAMVCVASGRPEIAEFAQVLRQGIKYALLSPKEREALHAKQIREHKRRLRRRGKRRAHHRK